MGPVQIRRRHLAEDGQQVAAELGILVDHSAQSTTRSSS
jgi:hypothetical protein